MIYKNIVQKNVIQQEQKKKQIFIHFGCRRQVEEQEEIRI